MGDDLTWIRTILNRRFCAMRGLEWRGYVGTHCDQIHLIEDIDEERRVIEPEQACSACVAALEREQ